MAPGAFLQTFLKTERPKEIRLAAAQGTAPIPPEEMLELLVHLHRDPDPEVAAQAQKTLGEMGDEEVIAQLRKRSCSAAVLEYFATFSLTPAIQESVILNPSASPETIAALALRVPAPLLETILYNRVRLLEHPAILVGVKSNPALTTRIQVLVQEIETEFFGSKKTEYAVDATAADTAPAAEIFPVEEEMPAGDLSLEGLPLDPEEREAALFQRIAQMSVPQRMQLALRGTREARAILVRDSNRDVARSVLKSPKVSDGEVESFAAMRNVSDEILRLIGSNKEWTKNYGVVQNLVKNPRTPPMIAQQLLFRLRTKDLSLIVRDRGVSEAVRRNAQRTLSARTSSQRQ